MKKEENKPAATAAEKNSEQKKYRRGDLPVLFGEIDVKKPDSFNPASKKLMTKLKQLIRSIQFMPYKGIKKMEKMREIGTDPTIAAWILKLVKSYDPLPLGEIDTFDVETFSKLWAALMYSPDEETVAYFDGLADYLIGQKNYAGLSVIRILLLCFRCLETRGLFAGVIEKLEDCYEGQKETLPVYVWAKQLGLPSPEPAIWGVSFELESDGWKIIIGVGSFDNYGTYTVRVIKDDSTVWGELRDRPFSETDYYGGVDGQPVPYARDSGLWESPTGKWNHIKNGNHPAVPISFDLLHIKEFIAALEKRYNFKIDRTLKYHGASKGIDLDVIRQWIRE